MAYQIIAHALHMSQGKFWIDEDTTRWRDDTKPDARMKIVIYPHS